MGRDAGAGPKCLTRGIVAIVEGRHGAVVTELSSVCRIPVALETFVLWQKAAMMCSGGGRKKCGVLVDARTPPESVIFLKKVRSRFSIGARTRLG
jgi:hypothetical protein